MTGPRPLGVTIVAIITWINGLFNLVPGIIGLFSGGNNATNWISIVLGALTIAIGSALLGGRNWSRIIVTILFVLSLAAAVYLAVSVPGQLWQAIVSGGLAIIGLVFLWSKKANAFFS